MFSEQYSDLILRAYHIILAVPHLTLDMLTEALRFHPDDPMDTDNLELWLESATVQGFLHNFVVVGVTGNLSWAHDSARVYVQNKVDINGDLMFAEGQNQLMLAKQFLKLLSNRSHPAWLEAGLNLEGFHCFLNSMTAEARNAWFETIDPNVLHFSVLAQELRVLLRESCRNCSAMLASPRRRRILNYNESCCDAFQEAFRCTGQAIVSRFLRGDELNLGICQIAFPSLIVDPERLRLVHDSLRRLWDKCACSRDMFQGLATLLSKEAAQHVGMDFAVSHVPLLRRYPYCHYLLDCGWTHASKACSLNSNITEMVDGLISATREASSIPAFLYLPDSVETNKLGWTTGRFPAILQREPAYLRVLPLHLCALADLVDERLLLGLQDAHALQTSSVHGKRAFVDLHLLENSKKQTALHLAAGFGRESMLRFLKDKENPGNKSDVSGLSPLSLAIMGGHSTCVNTMLGVGDSNEAETVSIMSTYLPPDFGTVKGLASYCMLALLHGHEGIFMILIEQGLQMLLNVRYGDSQSPSRLELFRNMIRRDVLFGYQSDTDDFVPGVFDLLAKQEPSIASVVLALPLLLENTRILASRLALEPTTSIAHRPILSLLYQRDEKGNTVAHRLLATARIRLHRLRRLPTQPSGHHATPTRLQLRQEGAGPMMAELNGRGQTPLGLIVFFLDKWIQGRGAPILLRLVDENELVMTLDVFEIMLDRGDSTERWLASILVFPESLRRLGDAGRDVVERLKGLPICELDEDFAWKSEDEQKTDPRRSTWYERGSWYWEQGLFPDSIRVWSPAVRKQVLDGFRRHCQEVRRATGRESPRPYNEEISKDHA
jgi:hypothetical protein